MIAVYLPHQRPDRADGGGPEQRMHDDEDHRGDGRDHRAEPVQVDEEALQYGYIKVRVSYERAMRG